MSKLKKIIVSVIIGIVTLLGVYTTANAEEEETNIYPLFDESHNKIQGNWDLLTRANIIGVDGNENPIKFSLTYQDYIGSSEIFCGQHRTRL